MVPGIDFQRQVRYNYVPTSWFLQSQILHLKEFLAAVRGRLIGLITMLSHDLLAITAFGAFRRISNSVHNIIKLT